MVTGSSAHGTPRKCSCDQLVGHFKLQRLTFANWQYLQTPCS